MHVLEIILADKGIQHFSVLKIVENPYENRLALFNKIMFIATLSLILVTCRIEMLMMYTVFNIFSHPWGFRKD